MDQTFKMDKIGKETKAGRDMVEKPKLKIGHYIIGDTLGVGTFGKVKSKLPRHLQTFIQYFLLSIN